MKHSIKVEKIKGAYQLVVFSSNGTIVQSIIASKETLENEIETLKKLYTAMPEQYYKEPEYHCTEVNKGEIGIKNSYNIFVHYTNNYYNANRYIDHLYRDSSNGAYYSKFENNVWK